MSLDGSLLLAKRSELCSMLCGAVRERGLKSQDFPVKFPVSREFGPESGSLETPSTAMFEGPSTPLRISPAGSRFAHARKTDSSSNPPLSASESIYSQHLIQNRLHILGFPGKLNDIWLGSDGKIFRRILSSRENRNILLR